MPLCYLLRDICCCAAASMHQYFDVCCPASLQQYLGFFPCSRLRVRVCVCTRHLLCCLCIFSCSRLRCACVCARTICSAASAGLPSTAAIPVRMCAPCVCVRTCCPVATLHKVHLLCTCACVCVCVLFACLCHAICCPAASALPLPCQLCAGIPCSHLTCECAARTFYVAAAALRQTSLPPSLSSVSASATI